MEPTSVRTVAVWANLSVGTFRRTDNLSHFRNSVSNLTGISRHFGGHIPQCEKVLWLNLTVPNVLVVDVANDAAADFYSSLCEDPQLKRQIGNVFVFE